MSATGSSSAAPDGFIARFRHRLHALRVYTYRALWDLDVSQLSRPSRWLLTTLRLGFVTIDSFFRENLHTRSAALAFFTLLAIVPLAALTFSVAKTVGAYDLLVDETIRPLLDEAFRVPRGTEAPPAMTTLRQVIEDLIRMVQSTNVFGLGLLGLGVLFITIRRVVSNAQDAFDAVWGFRTRRRILLSLPGYASVAIFAPLALLLASAMTAARQGQPFMAFLSRAIPVPYVGDVLVFILPPLLVWLAMFQIYVIVPGARVRRRSAMIGALVGGLGWYVLQILHVSFQIGVARQNAIYSGFGAFPIFLVWLHLSWLWVLLGAQVAAVHQNAPTLRQLARSSLDDHVSRQAAALRAMVALADAEGPVALRELGRSLGVAVEPLRRVLDALVDRGLLTRGGGDYDPRYANAVDADATRIATVIEALGRRSEDHGMPWDHADKDLTELLEKLHSATESSSHNLTIGELRRDRSDPEATVVDEEEAPLAVTETEVD
ncbi:MAG: YhjD/YihY/BrkB family envelope integrity protein [Sandaracinaceae bacterium]